MSNQKNKCKAPFSRYKFAVIATDVVILSVVKNELRVLLMKMTKDPYKGQWALPGGLISGEETTEVAAKRHLYNKTNTKNVYLEQLYTFSDVERDPFGRVVSVGYLALIPDEKISSKLIKDTDWFSVAHLPKLAYDHKAILSVAIKRLKSKLSYTNIVHALMPQEFTLFSLQGTYETILGEKLDKRNFRKKLAALDLVGKVGKTQKGLPHRPAELYKFNNKRVQFVNILTA